MLGMINGPASVVPQRTWYHGENAYSPDDPGEMLASLQEITGRVREPVSIDRLELSRDDISRLTNKPEWRLRRSGYLGEDRRNPFKGNLDRGPNHPMFMFFIDQFNEIAPVDGNPDSISPYDLVEIHPQLDRQPDSFWDRLPKDAGKLARIFQLLLTRAGKVNGELTLEDLSRAGRLNMLQKLAGSQNENEAAVFYSGVFGNEFNIIAPLDGDSKSISIYDLVVRNRECPEVERPTYPFRMKIKGLTGPRPGY